MAQNEEKASSLNSRPNWFPEKQPTNNSLGESLFVRRAQRLARENELSNMQHHHTQG